MTSNRSSDQRPGLPTVANNCVWRRGMNGSGLIAREHKANCQLASVLGRLVEVVTTLAREFLAYCWSRVKVWLLGGRSRSGGVYFRTALDRLGPTFIKLGQILANQVDVVPASVQRELSSLLDHAASIPGPAVSAEIAKAYGCAVNDVFDFFDLEPIASASISQVHEATLAGKRVAVKVRRPGVVAQVENDLFILSLIARTLHRASRRARAHDIKALVAQVAGMVRAELDFEAEAANAESARVALAGTRAVVPFVYQELTRPNVLVMDYIVGVPLSDHAALDACAHDGREIATTIMSAALCMMNGDRFHCDLHPGNILYLPDGRIAILDYGACGTSSQETRDALSLLLFSLATTDARGLSEGALAFMVPTRPYDLARFSERLREILFPLASSPLGSIAVGRVLLDLLGVMRKYGLRLQADVALLVKAIITAEATARDLHPASSFSAALLAFVTRQPPAGGHEGRAAGQPPLRSPDLTSLESVCPRRPAAPEAPGAGPVVIDLSNATTAAPSTPDDEPQPLSLTSA
jgi:ubiquinone biosynthesis protein